MENITVFRECYERWAEWIGVNQITKNSIWHQCTEMMNNEFIFQALFLAGRKAAAQPDFHSYLSANSPLYRYLLDGYLSFQYIAIRRLTDHYDSSKDKKQVKGVVSLSRLINDMKRHSVWITREVFVCVDGLPYDYAETLKKERKDAITVIREYSNGEVWSGAPGIGAKSAQRHSAFDRLSGVSEDHRQPTDTITSDYWQQYYDALREPELRRIKNFVDKFLAHAADESSLATLDEEDKGQSMQRIRHAQRCMINLVQRLTLDFYDTPLAMVPTYGEAQLLYNFDKPFVSAQIAAETYQELHQKVKEQLSLL